VEQIYAAWDWLIANWQVIALVVIPFLTTLVLKLGRIGWMLARILERVKDGTLTTQEKADTFDDVIAVFRGWLPDRSKKV
jgi:uncharacterized SAM-binding protein YcdF (DUF218 family)